MTHVEYCVNGKLISQYCLMPLVWLHRFTCTAPSPLPDPGLNVSGYSLINGAHQSSAVLLSICCCLCFPSTFWPLKILHGGVCLPRDKSFLYRVPRQGLTAHRWRPLCIRSAVHCGTTSPQTHPSESQHLCSRSEWDEVGDPAIAWFYKVGLVFSSWC